MVDVPDLQTRPGEVPVVYTWGIRCSSERQKTGSRTSNSCVNVNICVLETGTYKKWPQIETRIRIFGATLLFELQLMHDTTSVPALILFALFLV